MPGPLCLILETSSPKASLLLAGPDGVLAKQEFTSDRAHNASLFAPLREVLAAAPLSEIGLVLVGSGPGSYGGTRVGLAAAQGVALTAGCDVVAVPSVLAAPSAENGTCQVIGDARRGSYWVATITEGKLTTEPQLMDRETFQSTIHSCASLVSFEDPERTNFPISPSISFELPDAHRLWKAWLRAEAIQQNSWRTLPPQPHYLKPPHITASKRTWPGVV